MNQWHLCIASSLVWSLLLPGCAAISVEPTPTLLPEPTLTLTPVPTATETPTMPPTPDLRPEYQGKRLELQSSENFTLPIEGRQVKVENYGPVVRIFLDANQGEYIELNVDEFQRQQRTLEKGRVFRRTGGKVVEFSDMFAVMAGVNSVNDKNVFYNSFDIVYAVPIRITEDGNLQASKLTGFMHDQITSFSAFDKQTGQKIASELVVPNQTTLMPVWDIDFVTPRGIQMEGHRCKNGSLMFLQLTKGWEWEEKGEVVDTALETSLVGFSGNIDPVKPDGSEILGYANLVYLTE